MNNQRKQLIASGLVRNAIDFESTIDTKSRAPRTENDATIAANRAKTKRALEILRAAIRRNTGVEE